MADSQSSSGDGPVELPASLCWASLTDAILLRLCSTDFADIEPGFRATAGGRFDDKLKAFKTLYCAPDFETCYCEVLLRQGRNRETNRYEVPREEHDKRSLTLIVADAARLKLVDLFGDGIRKMGLDNSVTMSRYSETQALARQLHAHGDAPDGIVYPSRLGSPNRRAIVFFDRAAPHLRLFPGLAPTPLPQLQEAFDAVSLKHGVALIGSR